MIWHQLRLIQDNLRSLGIEDFEAESFLILESILEINKNDFLLRANAIELTTFQLSQIERILVRRKNEPLAYVLGHKWFYGYKFMVNESVLIPRRDSEILVYEVLRFLASNKSDKVNIIDLGCGSGCLSLTITSEIIKNYNITPNITLVDISAEALNVARENANFIDIYRYCEFINADFISPNFATQDMFDIVISNPPYIPSSEIKTLDSMVQLEPHIALDGGYDGLDFYRALYKLKPQLLLPDGVMFLEIGNTQANSLKDIFGALDIVKDMEDRDRVAIIKTVK